MVTLKTTSGTLRAAIPFLRFDAELPTLYLADQFEAACAGIAPELDDYPVTVLLDEFTWPAWTDLREHITDVATGRDIPMEEDDIDFGPHYDRLFLAFGS